MTSSNNITQQDHTSAYDEAYFSSSHKRHNSLSTSPFMSPNVIPARVRSVFIFFSLSKASQRSRPTHMRGVSLFLVTWRIKHARCDLRCSTGVHMSSLSRLIDRLIVITCEIEYFTRERASIQHFSYIRWATRSVVTGLSNETAQQQGDKLFGTKHALFWKSWLAMRVWEASEAIVFIINSFWPFIKVWTAASKQTRS
jgi:hypothetical protein